jgi:hypothetical protein
VKAEEERRSKREGRIGRGRREKFTNLFVNMPSEIKLNLHDYSYFKCLEMHNFGKEKYDLFTPILPKILYCKVVQFRSFRTKHAVMCKTHEQDTFSELKHVLCSLINMSDYFYTECLIL